MDEFLKVCTSLHWSSHHAVSCVNWYQAVVRWGLRETRIHRHHAAAEQRGVKQSQRGFLMASPGVGGECPNKFFLAAVSDTMKGGTGSKHL